MPEDQSTQSLQAGELSNLVVDLLRRSLRRGRRSVNRAAQDGRRQLDLRSLRKDRLKLYEKMGREVEYLLEAGEIDHPGLLRGMGLIRALDEKLAALEEAPLDQGSK